MMRLLPITAPATHLKRLLSLLMVLTVFGINSDATADDIEIFDSPSSQKPNILFVLDRSGSMDEMVISVDPTVPDQSRGDILQTALRAILEANKDIINAGLGPFYATTAYGMKWPISDLTVNANLIDPQIPAAAGFTSQSIMEMIFDIHDNGGGTNIVDALYESALYFRGEAVEAGNPSKVTRFEPDTWNATTNQYEINNKHAPHPATYSPQNAFGFGDLPLPVETGQCTDFSVGGTVVGGYNYCNADPDISRYDSCVYTAVTPGTGIECKNWVNTCNAYSIDGQCIDSTDTCTLTGPASDYPEHNVCTFYKENLIEATWAGANYQSPISDPCQINSIILLSDGDANGIPSESKIQNMTGIDSCSTTGLPDSCALELAQFLAENDQVSTTPNSKVKIYTVGFANPGPGQTLLEDIAAVGGGEFFPVSNSDQLNAAFDSIISSISGNVETFTAATVDVERGSFSSDNRAFFSMFQPSARRTWRGNLKGYFLELPGLVDVTDNPATEVIDDLVVFTETSQSFWSEEADGSDVVSGGAASKIDPASRNLYTNTSSSIGSGVPLTNAAHEMVSTNANITSFMLDGHDPAVLDWVRDTPMADPLHTEPVIIQYTGRTVVFVMTNQGFLHAFDATTPTATGDTSGGQELWSFMPQELLANLGEMRANAISGSHIYGLDGGAGRLIKENGTANGLIDAGDQAILYFGMRRGGSSYYALDVSNPVGPRLIWKITNGTGEFSRLGQSWSRPSLSTMMVSGVPTKVLIFGGGYDETLDGLTTRQASSPSTGDSIQGNDVYIVNAETGNVLWNANRPPRSNMDFAIPADISVIDTDSDGLADRFYFGDMGGQLWRADFPEARVTLGSGPEVEKIADFGSNGDFHPFFYPPDVALIEDTPRNYISLSIGSGSRDNPLRPTSANALFMVRDYNIDPGLPDDTSNWPLSWYDLYDITDNSISSIDPAVSSTAKTQLQDAQGWILMLDAGEKVLAKTVLFQNQLLFTTFQPRGSAGSADMCSGASTEGRFYAMDVRDGRPTQALASDGSTDLTTADRSKVSTNHGIPGSPIVVFPEDTDQVDFYVGQEKISQVNQEVKKLLWYGR